MATPSIKSPNLSIIKTQKEKNNVPNNGSTEFTTKSTKNKPPSKTAKKAQKPPASSSRTSNQILQAKLMKADSGRSLKPRTRTTDEDLRIKVGSDEDVAVFIEEPLNNEENARVAREVCQRPMCNYAMVPPRATAFHAPCLHLPCPRVCYPTTGPNDEDGVDFCFYPRADHATVLTFNCQPRKKPMWHTMMRCGFVPIINCGVPPACLPDQQQQYSSSSSSSSSSDSSSDDEAQAQGDKDKKIHPGQLKLQPDDDLNHEARLLHHRHSHAHHHGDHHRQHHKKHSVFTDEHEGSETEFTEPPATSESKFTQLFKNLVPNKKGSSDSSSDDDDDDSSMTA